MIEIRNLTKKYENATPLSDVNTTINRGDVIAVIGPSGTGKSTFLRCINRLEEPSGGEIVIDGESVTDPKCNLNKIRRKIGMVFQSFNLYEHLTVVENCMLAQTVLCKRSRQEAYDKAMKTLRAVGMERCALQYPDQLSGGQKQRAAIARTLCTDPEILLFDEPTSALDPIMVAEVEDVIEDLARQGRTMLIVTHSMDFARRIANRVFYMDQGGIYEDGPAEEVFDHPKGERTKKFLRRHACLEFTVTPETHNPEEEFGKIYKFAQTNALSPERTLKVFTERIVGL